MPSMQFIICSPQSVFILGFRVVHKEACKQKYQMPLYSVEILSGNHTRCSGLDTLQLVNFILGNTM